jgi:hypothetical protein
MLFIERFSLRLPPGYEHRADGISELVAQRLADVTVDGECRIAQLRVSGVTVAPTSTDAEVAGEIARAIQRELHAGPAGGGGV